MRTALTIAGSDSVGGAGIQADTKAMASVGVHATSVITAVTAQNTCRVSAIFPMSEETVKAQMHAVLKDCDIKAIKTGMLYNADIVGVVADELEDHDVPLVVDPVMIATVGDRLCDGTYIQALKRKLLPICDLVTPNRQETEVLSDIRIDDEDDMAYACEAIGKEGSSVLLKGGHFDSKIVTDYLYLSSSITRIRNPRLYGRFGHGSGCVFSAFITANMANGLDLVTSVLESRKMIQRSIETQYSIGKGVDIINTNAVLFDGQGSDMVNVLREMETAVAKLMGIMPVRLIPRDGMNMAYAIESAKGPEEIAGIDGRICVHNGSLRKGGNVKFGAGERLSYVLMETMKSAPDMRCVMTFEADETLEDRMKDAGLLVVSVRERDVKGDSVAQTVRNALSAAKRFPDAIIVKGRTNIVDLFGKRPCDVVYKLDKSI